MVIISPWDVKLNMTGVLLALLSTLLFSLYVSCTGLICPAINFSTTSKEVNITTATAI